MNNGYIVRIRDRVFGPYLTFEEADAVHKGSGDRSIQVLNGNDYTINVKDCGRSECGHCRSIKREANHALSRARAKSRREAASE